MAISHDIICILQQLEEEEINVALIEVDKSNIYITPPAAVNDTNEDNVEEDNGGTFDNLNSHELMAKDMFVTKS